MQLERRKLLALAGAAGASSLLGFEVQTVEASSHDWPDPRLDDGNTAHVTDEAPTSNFDEVWTKRSGSVATPVVSRGTVYTAKGSTLRAFDAEDGSSLWSFETDGTVEDTPALVDGTVYATGGAETYALDAEDGEEEWSHRGRGGTSASPKVEIDERTGGGTVYVAKDTTLYALGRSTGRQLWSTEVGGQVGGSPAFSHGSLYVSSSDGNLYSISTDEGNLDWRAEVGSTIETPPVVKGDSVFVVDSLGRAASFELDGTERWTNELSSSVTSPPAADTNHVYVPTEDGSLHAIRTTESGFEDWVFETDEGPLTAPAVAGDHVYVGAGGKLYVLKASDGGVVTEYDTASVGPPAVVGDRLYYGRNVLQALEGGEKEAQLRIVRASLDSRNISVGEQVTTSVTVENSGEASGSIRLRLKVDGETVESDTFEVSPGSDREVSLSHSFDTAGEYEMTVNDERVGIITVGDGANDGDTETDGENGGDEGNEDGGGQEENTTDDGSGDEGPSGIRIPLDGFGVGVASAAAVVTATLVKLVGDDLDEDDK